MHQREHDRRRDQARRRETPPLPHSNVNAVLALQRTIGNRSTTQVLARDPKDKNRPNFPNGVKFGKYGPIEIKGGNIAEWAAKKTPDYLKVVSAKGKHSDELKRLFDSKGKLDTVVTTSVVGENTLITITFKSCRIKHYSLDGETEEWTVEYEGANRESLSIGSAR